MGQGGGGDPEIVAADQGPGRSEFARDSGVNFAYLVIHRKGSQRRDECLCGSRSRVVEPFKVFTFRDRREKNLGFSVELQKDEGAS